VISSKKERDHPEAPGRERRVSVGKMNFSGNFLARKEKSFNVIL
jgi:hypothetical protein